MSYPGLLAVLFGFLLCLAPQIRAESVLPFEQLLVESRIERLSARLAYGHGALWIRSGFEVVRLDKDTLEASVAGPLPPLFRTRPLGLSTEAVWVADAKKNALYKLDPKTAELLLEIPVKLSSRHATLAFSDGLVWTLIPDPGNAKGQLLSAFDSRTGDRHRDIALPSGGFGVVCDEDTLWVTLPVDGQLMRIDHADGTLLSMTDLGGWPGPMVLGNGALWIYNVRDATVQRVDRGTGELIATIPTSLPKTPEGLMVFGGGYLWLGPVELGLLSQVDTATNAERRMIGGTRIRGLTFGDGSLWVSDGDAILRVAVPD